MIPSPNLDDRTFEDIVQEAITLIPKYCPEWTNHNPSDPGITLIELFAWMTEMVLYRLNKVTDKNYLAFLDLMGIQLQAPQPAQALLKFALAEGAPSQKVPQGTQVATVQTGTEDAVIFETTRPLSVIPVHLSRCYGQFHDSFDDHTSYIEGQDPNGFAIFQGRKTVERVLYIGDPRFAKLNDAALLRVNFTAPESVGSDFPRFLEWEYWNGRRWKEMMTSAMEFDRGEIVFDQIDGVAELEIDGRTEHWIRGRLVEVPQSSKSTLLNTIGARVEVIGEGIEPDLVLTNDDAGTFLPRDLSKNFPPFADHPKPDTILYLASEEYFGQPGAIIGIEIRLSDTKIKDLPKANDDLQITWEYHDGRNWQFLARTTPEGVEESVEEAAFEDGTLSFTQSGQINFRVPADIEATEVDGKESVWIRAKIAQGNFGEPGQYELDGDRWVWRNDNPLRPPYLKSMRLNYREEKQPPNRVICYNDFTFSDHTDAAADEKKDFQPFTPVSEESPSLYLGFDQPFPNEPVGIFFKTAEPLALEQTGIAERLHEYYSKQSDKTGEQHVVWEYWNGSDWTDLDHQDNTQNLTHSGFLDIIGPKDLKPTKRFGETLYWIRARLEMGGYVEIPRLMHISTNCVYALNQRTIYNELLGSSNGTPNQSFYVKYTPVLDDEAIWIRERERPSDDELEVLVAELGSSAAECFEAAKDAIGGYWVRWSPVESFYASTSRSRHYKKNPLTGHIQFGIGQKGMAPPMGENNVVARSYRVGGGSKGNVGPGTINTLRRAISHIDSIYNPYSAQGGSNQESIEEVKERGPYMIRSRQRAVTKEDFEWLSLQASNSIARATCLPSADREGEVTVVIVPKFDETTTDWQEKLLPSTELLRRVRRFLDKRRLVTTIVHVIKPRYVDVSISVEIVRSITGAPEKVKRDVERSLRVFLHAIRGGRNGKGWPFGRNILKMDLYRVIEEVDGVDFVGNIQLIHEDRNQGRIDQIKLRATELPYLVDVDITERSRQKIL